MATTGAPIVTIGSMSGLISNNPQRQAHYNAGKAGVHHLTKSLAGDWAERGVRVNSIALLCRHHDVAGWVHKPSAVSGSDGLYPYEARRAPGRDCFGHLVSGLRRLKRHDRGPSGCGLRLHDLVVPLKRFEGAFGFFAIANRSSSKWMRRPSVSRLYPQSVGS